MIGIVLEELSSPGCEHCKVFEKFWNEIRAQFPNVIYKNVSVVTPEGMELVQKYGIFSSPGVIINGELFSTGGVNKEKFLNKLKELSSQ